MLDLKRLQRIHLTHPRPRWQLRMARLLTVDYALSRTEVVIEGLERLPQDRPVFIAMNHTDRYNYWPFQWRMYRLGLPRFTTTWVKGKYFENPFLGWFMEKMDNLPMPSRGYLIAAEHQRRVGVPPEADQYRLLRDLLDGRIDPAAARPDPQTAAFLQSWAAPGADPIPAFIDSAESLFAEMMGEVMRIHHEALTVAGWHVLVFPEGTRSLTLRPGRTGLMQVAQHLGVPIVPVGCSGSDKLYPGNSPRSAGGRVVYRVGEPLEIDGPELGPLRITAPFVPFSRAATEQHGQRLAALTAVMMERISALIDPEYRAVPVADEQGVGRFL